MAGEPGPAPGAGTGAAAPAGDIWDAIMGAFGVWPVPAPPADAGDEPFSDEVVPIAGDSGPDVVDTDAGSITVDPPVLPPDPGSTQALGPPEPVPPGQPAPPPGGATPGSPGAPPPAPPPAPAPTPSPGTAPAPAPAPAIAPGDDVVPIAGDSTTETPGPAAPPAPGPGTDDVVPIAGDSTTETPPASGATTSTQGSGDSRYLAYGPLVRLGTPDEDDDDDFFSTWWSYAVLLVVALVAIVSGAYMISTHGRTSTIRSATTTTGAAVATTGAGGTATSAPATTTPGCTNGQRAQAVVLNGVAVSCTGPAQYPTDTTSGAYSYFAQEFTYDGGDVQLVVTGPPLTGPVTVPVSSDISAVSAQGAQLADVDLYDNGSSQENLATGGSVSLNPDGQVGFDNVVVPFNGTTVTIEGTMDASTGPGSATPPSSTAPPTTSAPPSSTAPATGGVGARVAQAYLGDVGPVDAALGSFGSDLQHWDDATSDATARSQAAHLVSALQAGEGQLEALGRRYPAVRAEFTRQTQAVAAVLADLHELPHLQKIGVGAWIQRYQADVGALARASSAVRSTLGLPASPQG